MSVVGTSRQFDVTHEVSAKTVPELIAYAKANPGKINIAFGPIGGPAHVAAERLAHIRTQDLDRKKGANNPVTERIEMPCSRPSRAKAQLFQLSGWTTLTQGKFWILKNVLCGHRG
jgi:hypothetical protein